MHSFVYDALPGRVVFGEATFDRLPDEIARLRARRVLIVADRSAERWADRLATQLGSSLAARIADVRPHVPIEDAEAGRRLAARSRADAIVTLGGGSATGLGKAIALERPLPIVAVPTTYAGSEMTPIWGLTRGAQKETGRDPVVQPRTVVYDPLLTLSLPASVAGPSGMNALAHCAEAMYAEGANPITTLMAEQGVRILAAGLPRVVARPADLSGRSDVLAGAYLAGASFAAAGSGIHHKICHVLGGAYDLPHAEMHSVLLPYSLAFVAPAAPDAMARLAIALGTPDVPAAVFDLGRAVGAPADLVSIGMHRDRLDEAATLIAAVARDYPLLPVTVAAMRDLLEAACAGRRPEASLFRAGPAAATIIGSA